MTCKTSSASYAFPLFCSIVSLLPRSGIGKEVLTEMLPLFPCCTGIIDLMVEKRKDSKDYPVLAGQDQFDAF